MFHNLKKIIFIIPLFFIMTPFSAKSQEVTISNAPLTPVMEEPLESNDIEVFGDNSQKKLNPVPQNIPQNIQRPTNMSSACETATMAYQKIFRDIVNTTKRGGFATKNETYKILLEEWRNIHQRMNCDPMTLFTIIDNTTRTFLGLR